MEGGRKEKKKYRQEKKERKKKKVFTFSTLPIGQYIRHKLKPRQNRLTPLQRGTRAREKGKKDVTAD